MNKYILTFALLLTLPAFATCPVDSATSCSLAELVTQPLQMNSTESQSLVKEFGGRTDTRLQPARDDSGEKSLRNFGSQSGNYNYNSNCQFGICSNTGSPKLFQRRGN